MVAEDVKIWNRKPVLTAKGKLKTVVGESAANPQRGRLDARRLDHCVLEAKYFYEERNINFQVQQIQRRLSSGIHRTIS